MAIQQVTSPSGLVAKALKERIITKNARVGVIGLGYVGLPFAVEKAKVHFSVLGFDNNQARCDMVNKGQNYIKDVKSEELKEIVERGFLKATSEFSYLDETDVVVICVPTPLTVNKDPDISYIQKVTVEIAKHLHKGQLITLESTTYPGTTEEVILPLLEKSGLKVGEDFFLAFSPERVDPGNQRYTTKNTSKVVGGVTPTCLDMATTFYSQTILDVVPVSSPAVAEMTKVFENTYRAVNIALVNELMLLCDRMGIDVWEVVQAAGTKPFGIQTFYPGPGVGGHCIPIDPFYLTWKAREYGFHTRFIELAGEINDSIPEYVFAKVTEALNHHQKSVNGSKILILGVAYKKDIDDVRESPALKIIRLLKAAGATVSYSDPYISSLMAKDGLKEPMVTVTFSEDSLKNEDCVVIATDHSDFDYKFIVENSRLVVDTRNATGGLGIRTDHVFRI